MAIQVVDRFKLPGRGLHPLKNLGVNRLYGHDHSVGLIFRGGGRVEAIAERDWDLMRHGIHNTRYLNTYSQEQELEFC